MDRAASIRLLERPLAGPPEAARGIEFPLSGPLSVRPPRGRRHEGAAGPLNSPSQRTSAHWEIQGGIPLEGVVRAGGSKNATLPMMAASILAQGPLRLEGAPWLDDVATMARLLGELGVSVRATACGALDLEAVDRGAVEAGGQWVRRMRASFCVLGPLLASRRRAIVPLPGGCNIGPRPVDLHLKGLAALGAQLRIEQGRVVARAERLTGATVNLWGPRGPTVTGTANVLSAAVLARGVTVIRGAASEPEVVDLGRLLVKMGARIEGLGTRTLRVTGVPALVGAAHRVIPDRIEAATLLLAAAITRGSVTVNDARPEHLEVVIRALRQAGFEVETAARQVGLRATRRPHALRLVAKPYPGLPSDLQAQWMALLSLARGRSRVQDRVFPARLMHVDQLRRLGARITLDGQAAVIRGVTALSGATVTASDLRASAALVLAGLAASGTTVVEGIGHLDRGYENLDRKLRRLGARLSPG
ncbi:MAG TPA: UDP-N-acetylglucosamine 1-carboxyvinyltransferase [Planctomycetes bacterium]|nr:UDP-N-acetylglucosamine 1-carboxyvinyltransferase [Planctomycetota bacterium]